MLLILLSSTFRNSFTSTNLRSQLVFINTYLHKHILGASRPGKLCSGYQRRYYSSNNSPKYPPLNPEWITGFTDAEGSFGVKIFKSKGYKLGWRINPFFQIKLNIRDLQILNRIQVYFGGIGIISFENNFAKLVVSKPKDLLAVVIPHFVTYPLLTQKYADFELFRQILLIMSIKGHRTEEGFLNVLNLRYNLNKGISEELKELYPNLVPVDRPFVPERDISPEWLAGFVDGEGSFNVITTETKTSSPTTPISRRVWLYFQITQHGRDILLMERIVAFLGCGSVKKRNTPTFDTVDYKLVEFYKMENIIIPFFKKYPLESAKLFDLQCFIDAAGIIKQKSGRSWTLEQFNKIKSIQNMMNKYTESNLQEVDILVSLDIENNDK